MVAVSTSPGLIRASLLCLYAGILAGNSLSFNVTVETDQGSEVYNQTYEYTDYTNNTNRSVSIPVNGGMMYYAEVFAINEHGFSELTRLGPFNVTVNVTEAPTEEECKITTATVFHVLNHIIYNVTCNIPIVIY